MQEKIHCLVGHDQPWGWHGVQGSQNSWVVPSGRIQGGFDPSKKSGVGVVFGLVVRCLLLGNKGHAQKPSMILGKLMDKTKRVSKARVSDILFQNKIFVL